MRIGDLADQIGTTKDIIHFYESSEQFQFNDYSDFLRRRWPRVTIVRTAQALGFSLARSPATAYLRNTPETDEAFSLCCRLVVSRRRSAGFAPVMSR